MTTTRYLAAALLAAAAVPSSASAGVTITSITGDPGFLTSRISYAPGGLGANAAQTSLDVLVGRLKMSGVDTATAAAVAFNTYCIDIFNFAGNGTFDVETFALGNAVKEQQLKTLLSNTDGMIGAAGTIDGKKNVSAAIQLAVWEIVNETGTGGYALGTGQFQVNAGFGTVVPAARSLAQGYLDSLGTWSARSGYSYSMMSAVIPSNNQRQITFAAGAVPEPGTWALLIAGFGAIGGAMRRSRRSQVAFA